MGAKMLDLPPMNAPTPIDSIRSSVQPKVSSTPPVTWFESLNDMYILIKYAFNTIGGARNAHAAPQPDEALSDCDASLDHSELPATPSVVCESEGTGIASRLQECCLLVSLLEGALNGGFEAGVIQIERHARVFSCHNVSVVVLNVL